MAKTMTDISPHIGRMPRNRSRRRRQRTTHPLKHILLLRGRLTFYFSGWIFHVCWEWLQIAIQTMLVGRCTFPFCLMFEDVELGLSWGFL